MKCLRSGHKTVQGSPCRLSAVKQETRPARVGIPSSFPGGEEAKGFDIPDRSNSAILPAVREGGEWRLGHAQDAVHLPLSHIPVRTDEPPSDAQPYVVCRQGGRSLEAVKHLNRIGFGAVHVEGGMVARQRLGRPLTAEDDRAAKIY